jgi:hypothetical protein
MAGECEQLVDALKGSEIISFGIVFFDNFADHCWKLLRWFVISR